MKKQRIYIVGLLILALCVSALVGCEQMQLPSTTPSSSVEQTAATTVTPTTDVLTMPTTVPTTTVQPTQPTEPTEPVLPTEPEDSFPAELRENVYLSWKNTGFCEEMTGTMMVTIVFLSDTESSWNEAAIKKAKAAFDADIPKLETQAATYGAQLDVQITYLESKIAFKYDYNDTKIMWAMYALRQHNLANALTNESFLEEYYQTSSAPVVFVLNREGRSYAMITGTGSKFEYVVMYSSQLTAVRHELCHIYGAVDFYVPDETTTAANEHLSGSIMLNSNSGKVDDLTAYLIGWTDTLTPSAEAFLRDTNHITREYLDEAMQGDHLTGYGTKRFTDCTYTGYMVSGIPNGEGTCTWDDGTVYTGNWENGKRSGYGEISAPGGYSYKGEWENDQYNGQGTLVYPGGKQTYTGQFQNGLRHGKGTHVFANGDVYTGDWVNGIWEGQGTYTWASGEVYEGQWVKAQRQGQGTMTWPDGSSYTGEWVNGKRTGYGVLYYGATGDRYEGEFENDKRHGQGTYYYADGTSVTGTWENDQLAEETQV